MDTHNTPDNNNNNNKRDLEQDPQPTADPVETAAKRQKVEETPVEPNVQALDSQTLVSVFDLLDKHSQANASLASKWFHKCAMVATYHMTSTDTVQSLATALATHECVDTHGLQIPIFSFADFCLIREALESSRFRGPIRMELCTMPDTFVPRAPLSENDDEFIEALMDKDYQVRMVLSQIAGLLDRKKPAGRRMCKVVYGYAYNCQFEDMVMMESFRKWFDPSNIQFEVVADQHGFPHAFIPFCNFRVFSVGDLDEHESLDALLQAQHVGRLLLLRQYRVATDFPQCIWSGKAKLDMLWEKFPSMAVEVTTQERFNDFGPPSYISLYVNKVGGQYKLRTHSTPNSPFTIHCDGFSVIEYDDPAIRLVNVSGAVSVSRRGIS